MNKRQKKVTKVFRASVIAVLCLMITVAACACKKGGSTSDENRTQETAVDLVKDNKSDYTIVVPEGHGEAIGFAVSELTSMFHMATGWELPVKSDSGYAYNESQKIISVGETRPFQQSGIQLDFNELYEDGSYLETKGSQVFLCGARDSGTINAVYDFLQHQFNMEIYASDEIYIDKVADNKLLDFRQVKNIPAIRTRAGGTAHMSEDPKYCARLRRAQRGSAVRYGEKNGEYATWAHTVQYMVPYSKYGAAHPEWYGTAENVALPMYFMDEEFKKIILDSVKNTILEKPESTAFQFGMNDNTGTCINEKTRAWVAERGGNGGALIAFANAVSRDVLAWLKEIDPERAKVFRFSILAYISYESAPVKFDETEGKYYPIHPDVVADDNVSVMICAYYANNNYSLAHDKNGRYKTCFEKWSAIAKNIEVWHYATNYSNYMTHYNNFQTIKENAQVFRDFKVSYIMDNGITISSTPFQIMRNYLFSKLWWNPDLDLNKLVDDFIYYYYKDAAPYIREYYDLVRLRYASVEADYAAKGDNFPGGMYETDKQAGTTIWSLGFTNKANKVLEQAMDAASKMINPEDRDKAMFRVKCETLSPRYFFLEHHSSSVSVARCRELIDSFEADASECGLSKWRESKGELGNKIDEWRNELSILEGV